MNKFFISLLIISGIILTGCGATIPITKTQLVPVPIATKCSPITNVTSVVEYPTKKMRKEMSLYEKNQLVIAELKIVKGQNIELKAALKECTK